jgi:phosphate:Na+ symporter
LGYTGHELRTGLQNLKSCIERAEKTSPEIDQIFAMEKQCDNISEKVHSMLAKFVGSSETTRPAVQQRIFTYERTFDSLESVSDYITQVVKLRLRLLDNKTDLLDYQKQDLLKLNDLILDAMNNMLPALELSAHRSNPQMLAITMEHEKKFAAAKEFIRSVRATLWNSDNGETPTNPIVNDSYSNMLTSYRKIRDHLRSYGNAILGIGRD